MQLPTPPVPAAPMLTYADLLQKYLDFAFPIATVLVNKKPLAAAKGDRILVNDIRVELSSGIEASAASFRIYRIYDENSGKFRYPDLEKQLYLGAPLAISFGYSTGTQEIVFVGFVTGIEFGFEGGRLPFIEVTGMDVKSLMMGSTYSYRLTASTYGEAVAEIFKRTGYEKLLDMGAITALEIGDTPDKKPGAAPSKATAETIEMVAESDYDFIAKAAQKFNYEFFIDRGKVIFRAAKSLTADLLQLGPGEGILEFHVGYSINGLVGEIEARSHNAGDGKLMNASKKFKMEGKANALIGSAKKVYIDPSIVDAEQAEFRANTLLEKMSYRLGFLEASCLGIPDLVPGRFITFAGPGAPVDNHYYLTSVVHRYDTEEGYRTEIIGCANTMPLKGLPKAKAGGGMGGLL